MLLQLLIIYLFIFNPLLYSVWHVFIRSGKFSKFVRPNVWHAEKVFDISARAPPSRLYLAPQGMHNFRFSDVMSYYSDVTMYVVWVSESVYQF